MSPSRREERCSRYGDTTWSTGFIVRPSYLKVLPMLRFTDIAWYRPMREFNVACGKLLGKNAMLGMLGLAIVKGEAIVLASP